MANHLILPKKKLQKKLAKYCLGNLAVQFPLSCFDRPPPERGKQRNRPNFPAFPPPFYFDISFLRTTSDHLSHQSGRKRRLISVFSFPSFSFFLFTLSAFVFPIQLQRFLFLLPRFRFKNVQFLSCQDFPQIRAKTTLKKK